MFCSRRHGEQRPRSPREIDEVSVKVVCCEGSIMRQLTGLRGVAAISVVFVHWHDGITINVGSHHVTVVGNIHVPVMLFFVLSGFLMGDLYMHKQPSCAQIKEFVIARCARILPLYIVLVCVCAGLVDRNALYYITLTHIAEFPIHFWTVPVEIQFYLCFIFLWWGVYHRRLTWVTVCISVLYASSVLRAYADLFLCDWHVHNAYRCVFFEQSSSKLHDWVRLLPAFVYFPVIPYLHPFLAGAALGYLNLGEHLKVTCDFCAPFALLLFALCQSSLEPRVFSTLTKPIEINGLGYYPWFSRSMNEQWFDPVKFVIVCSCVSCTSISPRSTAILHSSILMFLGEISFGIYLLHPFVLPMRLRLSQLYDLPDAVAVSLLWIIIDYTILVSVAWFSFTFFEVPARRLVRGLGKGYAPRDLV